MERLNEKSVIDKAIARYKQHGLRVVYHATGIYTSLKYTAADLKFPDTKTFRETFAEDTNVYQNIVEPLISFIRDTSLCGGTVGLFGPTIAYIAVKGMTLLDVDLTCASDSLAITKPSGTTAATAITAAACVQLIHFGPQQCFDRPARSAQNSAEFRGQFYVEDVNRAWVALKCLHREFDKAVKSSRMSTKPHNQSTSDVIRYLTEADFTGSTYTDLTSSVAQQKSLAERSLRRKANVQHTIAELHLTPEEKADLAGELESSIESALIEFKRLTATKEPDEIRPTFTHDQLISLGRDMWCDITTTEQILHREGKSVEQTPQCEAAEGSFQHLSALANTITSVGLAAGEDVTVAPEKYDQEEMDTVSQFQNELCKSTSDTQDSAVGRRWTSPWPASCDPRLCLIKWCVEEDRKLVVFSNWPLVDFDLRVTCSTLGLPFVSVSAGMSAAAREAAVREFSDRNSPVKILFSSLRVGAQSLNLQVATREIIVDYPTNAGISLQAINRVNCIGQTEQPEVHILMCANTVDHIIAARTQEKYLPIISGSGDLHASDEEIQAAMEEAKADKAIWSANRLDYRDKVIEGKAKAIYRRMFGSRCSHSGWNDLNLDLKDYMQDGPYEDKVGQKQEIIKRYNDDIAHSRADHLQSVQSAYRLVAEGNGISIEQLDMMLEHSDTILKVIGGERVTHGKAKHANSRARAIKPSGGEDVEMLQKSFGEFNEGWDEELFHKVNAQGKREAKVAISANNVHDSDEEMVDQVGE